MVSDSSLASKMTRAVKQRHSIWRRAGWSEMYAPLPRNGPHAGRQEWGTGNGERGIGNGEWGTSRNDFVHSIDKAIRILIDYAKFLTAR